MRMTKSERLIAECVYMSEKRQFTHNDLQLHFGISRTTSYDDIRFLRNKVHVPIAEKVDGTGLCINGKWSFNAIHLKPEYEDVIIELIHIVEDKYKKVLINMLYDYGNTAEAEKLKKMYL